MGLWERWYDQERKNLLKAEELKKFGLKEQAAYYEQRAQECKKTGDRIKRKYEGQDSK